MSERRPWQQPTISAVAITPKEGRTEKHERQSIFTVQLWFDNGDAVSVMYASLVGSPYFNPSHGIQMVFEGLHPLGWNKWKHGYWAVSIRGSNLKSIFDHLCCSKQAFVALGDNDDDASVKPHVTSISVDDIAVEVSGKMKE